VASRIVKETVARFPKNHYEAWNMNREGMTYAEIAKHFGVNKDTVGKWIRPINNAINETAKDVGLKWQTEEARKAEEKRINDELVEISLRQKDRTAEAEAPSEVKVTKLTPEEIERLYPRTKGLKTEQALNSRKAELETELTGIRFQRAKSLDIPHNLEAARQALTRTLRMFGLEKYVAIETVDRILVPEGGEAAGVTIGDLVRLSEQFATESTGFEEGLHAAQRAGYFDAQSRDGKLLREDPKIRAKARVYQLRERKAGREVSWTEAIEEAIAKDFDAYARAHPEYSADPSSAPKSHWADPIKRAYLKIMAFFRDLYQNLRYYHFPTTDSVWHQVLTGKMRPTETVPMETAPLARSGDYWMNRKTAEDAMFQRAEEAAVEESPKTFERGYAERIRKQEGTLPDLAKFLEEQRQETTVRKDVDIEKEAEEWISSFPDSNSAAQAWLSEPLTLQNQDLRYVKARILTDRYYMENPSLYKVIVKRNATERTEMARGLGIGARDLDGDISVLGIANTAESMLKEPPVKGTIEELAVTRETKKVTEMMAKAKVDAVDQTVAEVNATAVEDALKSILDSIKTRLRNQIDELERHIASRTKIQKDSPLQVTDAEVDALRSERDKLKDEYDDIFAEPKEPAKPKTNAERLADAKARTQARIDAIRRQIAEKKRDVISEKKPLHEDMELMRMQEVEKALQSLLDKYITPPGRPHDAERRIKSEESRLTREIMELNDQINEGQRKVKKKPAPADSEMIRALREIRDFKKEVLDYLVPKPPLTEQQRSERAVRQMERMAKELEDRIAAGDIGPRQRGEVFHDTPEMKAAREHLDALRIQMKELRDAAKPKETLAERVAKRIESLLTDKKTKPTSAENILANTLRSVANRAIKEAETPSEKVAARELAAKLRKSNAWEYLAEAVGNREEFQHVWSEAKRILEEKFVENPYLEGFYTDDPRKFSFDTQTFFLAVKGAQTKSGFQSTYTGCYQVSGTISPGFYLLDSHSSTILSVQLLERDNKNE